MSERKDEKLTEARYDLAVNENIKRRRKMSELVPVDQIIIQNRIRKDHGDIDELAACIKKLGLLEPIIVTQDHILIAGERRLLAVKNLGWSEIKAEITTAVDREQQLLMEIAENENRKEFTPSERVAYGLELEVIESLKARARMESGHNQFSPSTDRCQPSEKGKTDAIVGEKVGLKEQNYRRAKRVVESGNQKVIDKMDKGEFGISTAYEVIKGYRDEEGKLIPKPIVPEPSVDSDTKSATPEAKPEFHRDEYEELDIEVPIEEIDSPIVPMLDNGNTDFSFLAKGPQETEEDRELNDLLNKTVAEAELMQHLKNAVCVPVVAEFILKSIKEKLIQYPDTIENSDNAERKAFVTAFNVLKSIIRKAEDQ